jgi:hypothetical protein
MGESMLPTHGRYEYSPITRRPRFRWPGGQKLAVYFAFGIEHYAFGEGLTENLVAGMPAPAATCRSRFFSIARSATRRPS